MKKKIWIPIVVAVFALTIATPFIYKAVKADQAQQQLESDYAAYLASNEVFYPNSSLNGTDISGKTPAEVKKLFEEEFDQTVLTIRSARTMDSYDYPYSSLHQDFSGFEAYVDEIFAGQSRTLEEYDGAVADAVRAYEYDLYDIGDFSNADFSEIPYFDETLYDAPIDAYARIDVSSGECDIVKEEEGTLVDSEKLIPEIKAALSGRQASLTISEEDYFTPSILSDDPSLVETERYYETILNKTVSIGVCGLSTGLKDSRLKELFVFQDDTLSVDSDALAAYVDKLKNKYDSYNKTYSFHTTSGTDITLDYGNYGWTINKDKTVEVLTEALLKDEESTFVECEYTHTCSRPTNALQGNSYVEVSLAAQKIWMYKDGQLIVTDDCTTGDITEDPLNTVPGFFHVSKMQTDCTLKGPDWSDFVHYWILCDDAHAIGLHDATWREDWEFGGSNRQGNGSHGCVNLRLNTAQTIFNNLTMDMPIIIW